MRVFTTERIAHTEKIKSGDIKEINLCDLCGNNSIDTVTDNHNHRRKHLTKVRLGKYVAASDGCQGDDRPVDAIRFCIEDYPAASCRESSP